VNQCVDRLNRFNQAVFEALSISPLERPESAPVIVTESEFDPEKYGDELVRDFRQRLGVPAVRPVWPARPFAYPGSLEFVGRCVVS